MITTTAWLDLCGKTSCRKCPCKCAYLKPLTRKYRITLQWKLSSSV